jgi:protein O-mannosyl-transferase
MTKSRNPLPIAARKVAPNQSTPVQGKPSAQHRWLPWVLPMGILMVVWLLYADTHHHAFHFDDLHAIQKNETIRSYEAFRDVGFWANIHNRPLSLFTFAVNYRQGNLDPVPYHRTNILIHALSAILLFFLIRTLLHTEVMRGSLLARFHWQVPLFVSLLFALHPLQVQSVTYLVQRMASMAWMFSLAALLAFVQGRLMQMRGGPLIKVVPLYLTALLAFLAAMLSKQSAAAILLVMLAAEYLFVVSPSGKPSRRFLLGGIALLGTGAIAVILSGWIPAEKGALPPLEYLATQMRVILKYLQLLFVPIHLTLDYGFSASKSLFEPLVIISAMVHLVLFTIAFYLRKRNPFVAFGIFLFYLPLAVTSTIFPIRDVIFEHRLYLSVAGFALSLISLVMTLTPDRYRMVGWMFLTLWVGVMGYGTIERNMVWKDTCTLWEDTLEKSPTNSRAWLAVAGCLKQRGDFAGAIKHYDEALRLDPENPTALNNRGNLKLTQNDLEGAIADYDAIISFSPESRNLALINRGMAFMKKGDNLRALGDFNRIIEGGGVVEPQVFFHRALNYVYLGDYSSAEKDFLVVLEKDPSHQDALFNLASALMNMDRTGEAVKWYTTLLSYNPNHAASLHFRGVAYLALGKRAEACNDLRQAAAANYPPSAGLLNKYCTEFTL